MSRKTANILKAVFFTLLAISLIVSLFTDYAKSHSKIAWAGIIVSVITAVAYFKQAFDK